MSKEHIFESYRRNIVFLGSKEEYVKKDQAVTEISFQGTGFVVDGQYVVTALETVRRLEKVDGTLFAGVFQKSESGIDVYRSVPVTLIDTDEERSIAVLKCSEIQNVGFSLDDLETDENCIKEGVEALVLGFPIQMKEPKVFLHQCSVGSVVNTAEGGLQSIILDAVSWFTPEGAPVIDKDTSKIIGVVTGSFDMFAHGARPVCLSQTIPTACSSLQIYDMIDDISTYPLIEDSELFDDERV